MAVMFGLSRPAAWTEQALCREVDPDLFYADKGDWHSVITAKLVCRRCPVRDACLAHALETNEVHGVWGGLSPQQRILWRQRRGMTSRVSVDDWHGTTGGYRRHYRQGTKVCERCREAAKVARAGRGVRGA